MQIEQNILAKNQTFADANRIAWNDRGLFAVNLLSSPGAGKTTLLVKTIQTLKARVALPPEGFGDWNEAEAAGLLDPVLS